MMDEQKYSKVYVTALEQTNDDLVDEIKVMIAEMAAMKAVIASLRWQLDLANGDRFEARCLAEGKGE